MVSLCFDLSWHSQYKPPRELDELPRQGCYQPYNDAPTAFCIAKLRSRMEKAMHLRPNYGPYLYNYALALVGAQRLDEARVQAQAAVKADPSLAEGHVLLGGLLARDQRLAEAASEYQQAVKLQPDLSRVHLDLGLILAAQGDLPGATEHLRKAAAGGDPNVAQQAALALRRIDNR